jgi:hypothetical protein
LAIDQYDNNYNDWFLLFISLYVSHSPFEQRDRLAFDAYEFNGFFLYKKGRKEERKEGRKEEGLRGEKN